MKKVRCLFEQSGVFRDQFRKLGYEAWDYDIENRFGKTDFEIDLFTEIEKASNEESSIFDTFTSDDLLMAFFPCTRFSAINLAVFNGSASNYKNCNTVEILERCCGYNKDQSYLYQMICKLFIIILNKGFKLILENPYTQPHFLSLYFPIKPNVIDLDRRVLGDNYCKPTQYWFVNLIPQNNYIHSNKEFNFGKRKSDRYKKVLSESGIDRSLISPKYAENFIKKYIIGGS